MLAGTWSPPLPHHRPRPNQSTTYAVNPARRPLETLNQLRQCYVWLAPHPIENYFDKIKEFRVIGEFARCPDSGASCAFFDVA